MINSSSFDGGLYVNEKSEGETEIILKGLIDRIPYTIVSNIVKYSYRYSNSGFFTVLYVAKGHMTDSLLELVKEFYSDMDSLCMPEDSEFNFSIY